MVSVIVPSYNSEKTIEKNLTALQNQTYDSKYEIILVDSSSDLTPKIVRHKFPHIHFIHLDKKTDPGTARNIGVKKSRGDIIMFIDSDCIAASDWIETLVALHQSTDFAAIGGAVLNANDPNNQVAWAGYFAEFREFIPERPQKEVDHIPTCNLSFKSNVLKSMDGFNPDYYPQEDLELNYRLLQAGHRILFYPGAKVYHNHRTTIKSFFAHQKKVGNITSRMLKILPLKGSSIARDLFLTTILLPILPGIKWINTFLVFFKYNRQILIEHFPAVFILALGLIPWTQGFYLGAIKKVN
jgi:GT2 family glycosyltransferase